MEQQAGVFDCKALGKTDKRKAKDTAKRIKLRTVYVDVASAAAPAAAVAAAGAAAAAACEAVAASAAAAPETAAPAAAAVFS